MRSSSCFPRRTCWRRPSATSCWQWSISTRRSAAAGGWTTTRGRSRIEHGTGVAHRHARVKEADRHATGRRAAKRAALGGRGDKKPEDLSRKEFEKELEKLAVELVKLQLWVQQEGLKIIVVFEGRDAAGKGGVIKCITERVSPGAFW